MSKTKNSGTCYLCQQALSHRMRDKHLMKCLEGESLENEGRVIPSEKEKIFLIKVFAGPFWIYLEMNGSSKLKDLDEFLRSIWLECCGHMSKFVIEGISYTTDPYSTGRMTKAIHQILEIGTSFFYEYDFGSTTELGGEVLASRSGKLNTGLRVLARNVMPEDVVCSVCQKPPEVICSCCFELCCKKCRKDHDCQEDEMMLRVVNSPRMGVCGYSGPE